MHFYVLGQVSVLEFQIERVILRHIHIGSVLNKRQCK